MKLWIEKELFQWEKNRYVHISLDESDPQITFMQFYNEKSGSSPEIPLENNKAEIPEYLLKDCLPIMVVACAGEKEDAYAIGRKQFKVIKRPRPNSYFDTDRYVIYDGGEEV